MPGDAVLLDQGDEVVLGVARERRLAEMRVGREEGLGPAQRLVKLQRPPPEIRIFLPTLSA